jgi:hypothetical protein
LIRSGVLCAIDGENENFPAKTWIRNTLLEASAYSKDLDALRRCAADMILSRRTSRIKQMQKFSFPPMRGSAPRFSMQPRKFENAHFAKTEKLGMFPDKIWLMEEDCQSLVDGNKYVTSIAFWFIISKCIPSRMYSQSKSVWVENDSSVALMFTALATAVPTGTVHQSYSSFLGTADNILIPICVDRRWSLAIVAREDAHATIFHFDGNAKCRHLNKLNDRLANWASANISWGKVIIDNAIVSVPCAEQNDGVSCRWDLLNNAANALQIVQTSRMTDLMQQ